MTGVCTVATFEAQAAIALELAARRAGVEGAEPYPFLIDEAGIIRVGEMLGAIAGDILGGMDVDQIAARFHVTVARMAINAAERARDASGINTAALSGGAFQNRLLLRLTRDGLRAAGFEVLTHRQVPANDGGLSLGQAAAAAVRGMRGVV
jgi:hydrogenase maturation protein HypF